jgi:hypothetical protein
VIRAVGYVILLSATAIASALAYSRNPLADLSGLNGAGRAAIIESAWQLDPDNQINFTMNATTANVWVAPKSGILCRDTNDGSGASYVYVDLFVLNSAGVEVKVAMERWKGSYAAGHVYVSKGMIVRWNAAYTSSITYIFTPFKNA